MNIPEDSLRHDSISVTLVKEKVDAAFPVALANLGDLVRIPGIAWDAFDPQQLERSAEAVAALLKDTGLVSILGVTDAVRAAQIASSRTFNYTPYVTAAILFLIITIPLTRYTDRVLAKSIKRQNAQGAA
jgi:hypothetical protein